MRYLLSAAVVMLFLTGCATTISQLPPEEKEAIQIATFKVPYKKVFSATVDVFKDQGYDIAKAAIEIGFITTDYAKFGSEWEVSTGDTRTKISATVNDIVKTTTAVTLDLLLETYTFGSWVQVDFSKADAQKEYSEYFKLIEEALQE